MVFAVEEPTETLRCVVDRLTSVGKNDMAFEKSPVQLNNIIQGTFLGSMWLLGNNDYCYYDGWD